MLSSSPSTSSYAGSSTRCAARHGPPWHTVAHHGPPGPHAHVRPRSGAAGLAPDLSPHQVPRRGSPHLAPAPELSGAVPALPPRRRQLLHARAGRPPHRPPLARCGTTASASSSTWRQSSTPPRSSTRQSGLTGCSTALRTPSSWRETESTRCSAHSLACFRPCRCEPPRTPRPRPRARQRHEASPLSYPFGACWRTVQSGARYVLYSRRSGCRVLKRQATKATRTRLRSALIRTRKGPRGLTELGSRWCS